jgi:L-iditol 2-dehydrogenase
MSVDRMRAARLRGKEDLRVEEVPVPSVSAGEVLLRVKASAVCGTDIRMFKNGYRGVSPESPLILGHELSGVIERVGTAVRGYKEGTRVAVAPNMGCGVCDFCVSGNTQLCASYRAFGINIDGGFAEFVRIPEEAVRQGNLSEIPSGGDLVSVALAEPLSCVYNAFQRCAISLGDTVLVIGAGPIGVMHAKLALAGGAARVYMNDVNAERLALCAKLEPRVAPVESARLAERIRDETGGKGLDVVITANPSPEAQSLALELAAINGRVMFFGGLPEGKNRVALDTNFVHYKQIIITGTTRQSLSQFRRTLALIAAGLVKVDTLVTSTFPIERTKEAFEQVMQGRGLKNVVVFP